MKAIKFLPPVIIIPVLFLFIYQKPVTIYPGKDISIYKYSDNLKGGNSEINSFIETDSLVSLTYTLRKGVEFPYAGISFQRDTGYLPDLSLYDYIDLDATTQSTSVIQMFLMTYEPGVTKENIPLSYRHILQEVSSRKQSGIQRILLENFKTPEWWYSHVNLAEKDLGEPHLDMLKGVNFNNSLILRPDTPETITIRGITFGKTYTFFFLWSFIASVLYYGVIGSGLYIRKKLLNVRSRVIPYKQIEIEENGNPVLQKSLEYLSQNYTDPELNLTDMARELGFNSRNISDQLKNHFNFTFKQCLNSIRLNEARRLLKETALPVNEIAWKVGYNNVSHFNRAFRQYSDCSPQEFRQQK